MSIITPKCSAGTSWGRNRQTGKNGCLPKVEFYGKNRISLGETQKLAAKNGWVIANAQEVENAWNQFGLNVFAYGLLDDGRFAVPVQKDHPPTFKRGANVGVIGGNQGFFYVKKEAVSRKQMVPPPQKAKPQTIITFAAESIQIPDSVLTNPAFKDIKFAIYCNTNPGNPMLDGWNNADRTILQEAARELFKKEGKRGWRVNINELLPQLRTDPNRRREFAPFMLRAMWTALVSKNPNSAQVQFRKKFERWAACDEMKIAKMTLPLWNNHTGKSNSLDGKHWFGPVKKYKYNTLSVLYDTKTGRGSIEGFLPLDNPLFLGQRGQEALAMLLTPAAAHKLPEYRNSPLSDIGGDMSQTALHAGLSTAGFGIATTTVGSVVLATDLKKAAFTITTNATLKAKDLSAAAGKEIGAKVSKKAIAKLTAKNMLARLLGSKADDLAVKAASTGASQAAQQTGKLAAKEIATKLSSAFLVIGILATAGEIFGRVVADAARTDNYDRQLRYAAKNVDTEFTVKKYLGNNPSQFKKATIFTQLLKMTIADPADLGKLTLAMPEIKCPPELKKVSAGLCVWPVKFHSQAGLTFEQAKRMAGSKGWTLATPEEIEKAWEHLNLNVYAFGRTSDGKFAVPVQQDHSNFKKGANLDARGGNQGFFYTVGKPKKVGRGKAVIN